MATLSTKVRLGQFYTSPEVAQMMVGMADPNARSVLEPSCGPGAFLAALSEAGYRNVEGVDIDAANVAAARALCLAGVSVSEGDFLASARGDTYDLIMGNPPYVSWNRLSDATRARLLTDPFWGSMANGEWDLLYAFIVWSVAKLNAGGQLIFIVPYNWFTSTHAAPVRRYLADHGHFERFLSFGEFKVFADAYPNCIVFSYRRGEPANKKAPEAVVGEFSGRRGSIDACLTDLAATFAQHQQAPERVAQVGEWEMYRQVQLRGDDIWYLASPPVRRAVDAIERACAGGRLVDVADIGVGMVSGYDAAYLLDEDTLARVPARERTLVRRLVKARNCARYATNGAAAYIFPAGVADDEVLRRDYPWLFAHLGTHRAELERRYMGKALPWFAWATIRNMPLFERVRAQRKLFVPAIDRAPRARFAVTDDDVLGAGDVSVIAPRADRPESVLYLAGWLNSTHVHRWYQAKGSRTGARIRYTQSYLERIPTPRIDHEDSAAVAFHQRIVSLVGDRIAGRGDPNELDIRIDEAFAKHLRI